MPKRRVPLPFCRGDIQGAKRGILGMLFGYEIALENLISAESLLVRWGLRLKDLDKIIAKITQQDNGEKKVSDEGLAFCGYLETRIKPNGESIHFFTPPCAFCSQYYPGDDRRSTYFRVEDNKIIQGMFFYLKDVEAYEKKHPQLCLPLGPSLIDKQPSSHFPLRYNQQDIAKRDASITELEKALAEARQGTTTPNIEGHGFCSLVIRMRHEGKTDPQIAACLRDKGLSRSVIGALLSKDESVISEHGFRVRCDRLLPKK